MRQVQDPDNRGVDRRKQRSSGKTSALALLFLSTGRIQADLLVILPKGSEILARLRELTLPHTFTDVPVGEPLRGVQIV